MTLLRRALSELKNDIANLGLILWHNRSLQIVLFLSILPWVASILFHRNIPWLAFAEIGGLLCAYWFFTRGKESASLPVRNPPAETGIVLLFAGLWIAYRLAQYSGWLVLPPLHIGICDELNDTIVPKMVEMAIVPVILFLLARYSFPALGLGWPKAEWIPALIPLLVLVGWGLSHQTPQGLASRTGCFYFGAGLPEEVLFRALLIPRLAVVTRREEWGILLSGVVFGISHIPIDLHGSGWSQWQVALESAFTYQMGIGLVLGYAFSRTRNIWPLSFIHALIDSAPMV